MSGTLTLADQPTLTKSWPSKGGPAVYRRNRWLAPIFLVAILALIACARPAPAEEASPTSVSPTTPATVALSPEPAPAAMATAVPAEPTPEPTTETVATPVSAVADTPTPTPTPAEPPAHEATPTPTPTPPPTATPEPPEPTPTPTAVATQPEPTATPEPEPTAAPTEPSTNGGIPRAEEVVQTGEEVPLNTVEIVKILRPSVVHIATERLVEGMMNQPIPEGVGTGIVLDVEGHILTNNHVVVNSQGQFSSRIIVTLHTGESYLAEPVGNDFSTDTAVIRIDADGLQPAMLGDASTLEVGEDVVAIGHALDLPGGPTVSKGVVSGLGRSLPSDPQSRITLIDLIQTDAAINPGNSGGPLVNTRAEVIGINTAIIPQSQGIGFAINIDAAQVVAAQLTELGFVQRGFLGIRPLNVTPAFASQFDLPVSRGILLEAVFPDMGAETAGLEVGDIVVQLGDSPIANTGELAKFLLSHPPGETIDVVFFRGTEEMTVQLTLGENPLFSSG